MILWAASLALALQGGEWPEYEPVPNEEMEARLKDCGFEQVTAEYDEALQRNTVSIGDKEASDEQIKCAANAIDLTLHMPSFSLELTERYYAEAQELARPRAKAIAKAYFSEKPELGEVPMRAQGESEEDFAGRLESFCGLEAKGAFTAKIGALTISPKWGEIVERDFRKGSEMLGCLMFAATLNDLEVGIIGNERYAEESTSAE